MRKVTEEEAVRLWCPETIGDNEVGCRGTECFAFTEAGSETRWPNANSDEAVDTTVYTCGKLTG